MYKHSQNLSEILSCPKKVIFFTEFAIWGNFMKQGKWFCIWRFFFRITLNHNFWPKVFIFTLCYNESEWKKNEQVPIPLPKAASSLSDAKKMKKNFLSRWTAEIIQFIRYLIQMAKKWISVLFGCFWAFVRQPHGHLRWATSMPFASFNPTNPRTHTITKLDNYKKSTFSPQKIKPWSCLSGSDIGWIGLSQLSIGTIFVFFFIFLASDKLLVALGCGIGTCSIFFHSLSF